MRILLRPGAALGGATPCVRRRPRDAPRAGLAWRVVSALTAPLLVWCGCARATPCLQQPPGSRPALPRAIRLAAPAAVHNASSHKGRRPALGGLWLTSQARPARADAGDDVAKPTKKLSPLFYTTTNGKGGLAGEAVILNNGMVFPKASFGLQAYGFNGDAKARELTRTAVALGYRNFFASVLARNQMGFAMGIQDSGIRREDIFICGSVNTVKSKGYQKAYLDTKRGCEDNLKAFAVGGIDYVDMIMLDYPAADCESIRGQWKAFEEMLASGQTKSLAVSNFGLSQLDCILKDPSLPAPALNQLRYNVQAYDAKTSAAIVEENRKRGIVIQAWSPLRVSGPKRDLSNKIGQRYGKSAAQVMLRWILERGATYTTQSTRADHLAEDIRTFDFDLSAEEVRQLSA